MSLFGERKPIQFYLSVYYSFTKMFNTVFTAVLLKCLLQFYQSVHYSFTKVFITVFTKLFNTVLLKCSLQFL